MEARTGWREIGFVALVLAAARIIYTALGLSFDAGTFPGFMQFIDRELLANRLLESIWFYHAHPPLLNLAAGIGMKLFGDTATLAFSGGFLILSYGLALSVFLLIRRLSNQAAIAYIITPVVVFSPAFMLYGNWFMYTFPSATLLCLSAVALYEYLDRRVALWGHAFFVLLAALLLTRSLFHLIWLAGILAALLYLLPRNRMQLLAVAAIPVLVVGLWYGKNLYYFGSFSASSTFGLGLSNITTLTTSRADLEPLVSSGELSPMALVSRYDQTDVIFAVQDADLAGVPVLDNVRKSTGEYNYNNLAMLNANRVYTSDGIRVARHYPFNYVLGVIAANRLFFSPSSMNEYFSPTNRTAAAPLERIYNIVYYGAGPEPRFMVQPHFGFDVPASIEVNTGIGLILCWLVVLPYAYAVARRAFVSPHALDSTRSIVVGFILYNILYVYLTSTLFELGENYRYKFMIEPLFIVLVAVALADAIDAIKKKQLMSAPANQHSPP